MDEMMNETVVTDSVDANQEVEVNESPIEPTAEPSEPVQAEEIPSVEETPSNNGQAIQREIERRMALKEKEIQQRYEQQLREKDTYLERQARISGFDNVQEYLTAVEEYERQQEIEREAERLNVAPDIIKEHLQPLREEINAFKAEKQALENQRLEMELEKKLTDLRTQYTDFDNYTDSIVELFQKGYDLEHAYIVSSQSDRIAKAKAEAEQQAIRKLQENAGSSPGSLGAGESEMKRSFSSLSDAEQKKWIEEVKQGLRTNL